MSPAGSSSTRARSYELDNWTLKPEFTFTKFAVTTVWLYRSRMHNQLAVVTVGNKVNTKFLQFSYKDNQT